MKRILILMALICATGANAQDDTVRYELIYDRPQYTYWGAGISYDMSFDRHNFSLVGFGIDGVFINEKFHVNLHSNYSLFERLTDFAFNGHPAHESVYEPEKSREIGFSGSYFFTNNVSKVDQPVTLKTSGRVKYITYVPAKVSLRYGADIGFSTGVTYYNFGDAELIGVDNDGATQTLVSQDENDGISTMFSQHQLRIGATRTKTTNFQINTDKFGVKTVTDYTRIYAHVLVGFGQKMDDIFYYTPDYLGNDLYTRYDIQTNAEYLPVGGALGYEYYVKGKIGISWIAELGLMPGPKYSIGNNAYLNIKLRFHYGQLL